MRCICLKTNSYRGDGSLLTGRRPCWLFTLCRVNRGRQRMFPRCIAPDEMYVLRNLNVAIMNKYWLRNKMSLMPKFFSNAGSLTSLLVCATLEVWIRSWSDQIRTNFETQLTIVDFNIILRYSLCSVIVWNQLEASCEQFLFRVNKIRQLNEPRNYLESKRSLTSLLFIDSVNTDLSRFSKSDKQMELKVISSSVNIEKSSSWIRLCVVKQKIIGVKNHRWGHKVCKSDPRTCFHSARSFNPFRENCASWL